MATVAQCITIPYIRNKPRNTTETTHFRRLKQVNIEAFHQTVLDNLTSWYNKRLEFDNFYQLCTGFKEALQLSLEQHAPLLSKRLTAIPTINPHWFDKKYLQERRKRRSLERKYKRNKTIHNKHLLSVQRDYC